MAKTMAGLARIPERKTNYQLIIKASTIFMKNIQPDPDCLRDDVILVTGAGDGIGAVAAKQFAAFGATVVLLGRTVSKLEKVYDEIESAGCPKPAIYPLDLEGAGPGDYEQLASVIGDKLGQLNGILHNAAMLGGLTPIRYTEAETWRRALHVNLTAPFLLTRACLDLLKQSNKPRIVFTTHRVSSAYWGAYAVAKAGVERLMDLLADELSDDNVPVRVNAIAPGELQSPLIARTYPGRDNTVLPDIESVMPAYVYLMSSASQDINGKILHGNGDILNK